MTKTIYVIYYVILYVNGFNSRVWDAYLEINIFNHINPVFEKRFINDSYSCRIGKGTLYGIKRLDHFIRSCSENNKKDCYVLKLDIKGYFMSINREILYNKVFSPWFLNCFLYLGSTIYVFCHACYFITDFIYITRDIYHFVKYFLLN